MTRLDALIGLDLSDEIDRLPRQPGYQKIAARGPERFVTFHYSAVVYADRSERAERLRVLDEAGYQLMKNWAKQGRPPIYGDGLMYDLVALSSGLIVRTRKRRQQLWHCNNAIGNAQSWSVHVMLGPGQDLTGQQHASVLRVFDALCADGDIPRANVINHCEWPLTNGLPVRSPTYRLITGQSACPGPTLFKHVAAYRAGAAPAPATPSIPITPIAPVAARYQVTADVLNVRTRPSILGDIVLKLPKGREISVDAIKDDEQGAPQQWAHMDAANPEGDKGFASLLWLKKVAV